MSRTSSSHYSSKSECPYCGRWWPPSLDESESFPGSPCDTSDCVCTPCESDHPEPCPRHGARARDRGLLTPWEEAGISIHADEDTAAIDFLNEGEEP